VTIQTQQGLADAIARLVRRPPDQLANYIASLAVEGGVIGERAELFIIADNVPETIAAVRVGIESLLPMLARAKRRLNGRDVGRRLEYLLDAIESVVLPVNSQAAFSLLVSLFERDGDATEASGEYHDCVARAYTRAADLMAVAAVALPTVEVRVVVERLMSQDDYGMRRVLASMPRG